MPGLDKHKQAGRSLFMDSVLGLANVLALASAFLLTPKLYGLTVEWVRGFVSDNYGAAWADFASFGWFCITAAAVFFIARASVGTALIMGGLAIATRFL